MRAPSRTVGNARRLRRAMSPPEARLWVRLRVRDSESPIFRRQHPIGPYVIDFYCPAAKLAVEVDGWGHVTGDRPARDERRDAWLSDRGVTTLRIPAGDVLRGCDAVVERIRQTALALLRD
ncbi:endonuclease domain-containing protein [Bauldia litoralis]|uniref:Very-short-patch-repair endonuclease n=1 Tax=Bauldia litoralis TaxID=665467 RepID=A0A1G6AJF2_9HYPH|nr:endonuclease domain-containing protein [Bauldia litoralis]SDB08528.1 Very-short-patch-repair endonuclease [Bauldia litoralis]